jgi:cytochrome o ubiquinol oxidase operon protein cyoD
MTPGRDYFADIGFWPRGEGLGSYLIGFAASLLFTLAAYVFVTRHMLAPTPLIAAVSVLALLQFFVQTAYFLHLGGRGASKERRAIFAGAAAIVIILVGGSLWIMFDLNQRMGVMPTTEQMEFYMQSMTGM